jgi:hypothetical protein
VTTAPLYRPGANYRVFDYGLSTGKTAEREALADSEGRLKIQVDCSGHEVSFGGPGTGAQPPVLLPVTNRDILRLTPGRRLALPIRIFNPRGIAMENVRAELSSAYPTVEILHGKAELKQIPAAQAGDLSSAFEVRFTAGEGDFARARLELKLTYDGYSETKQNVDVLVAPENMPAPTEVAILDGRTKTFPVFRQAGNAGGGAGVERTVTEGKGNGNGILEPGEQGTIWVRLAQGVDPFDKNHWCRAKVYTDSPWLSEADDIQEAKQREWTGGQNRTSLIELSSRVPGGTEIPMILDCESWSFSSTPDVRYGTELLYQPFQIHKHHLFAWKWSAGNVK